MEDASVPVGTGCVFCAIVERQRDAHVVLEEAEVVAFLDARPVFPGHTLVVPRRHLETLPELPPELVTAVFSAVQRVIPAMERALGAPGAFVGQNNVISQSVPHVHVHVVPRRKKDGLRGFFWPRHPYASDDDAAEVAARLRDALAG